MSSIQYSSNWLLHNNKKILFIDYSGCKETADGLMVLEGAVKEICEQLGEVLILTNFSGTPISSGFMSRASELEKSRLVGLQLKRAVYGITGVKRILLKSFNLVLPQKIHSFDSKEEALEWLTK